MTQTTEIHFLQNENNIPHWRAITYLLRHISVSKKNQVINTCYRIQIYQDDCKVDLSIYTIPFYNVFFISISLTDNRFEKQYTQYTLETANGSKERNEMNFIIFINYFYSQVYYLDAKCQETDRVHLQISILRNHVRADIEDKPFLWDPKVPGVLVANYQPCYFGEDITFLGNKTRMHQTLTLHVR